MYLARGWWEMGGAARGSLWEEPRGCPVPATAGPSQSQLAPQWPQDSHSWACWHLWENIFKKGQNATQQWGKKCEERPYDTQVREGGGWPPGPGFPCSPWGHHSKAGVPDCRLRRTRTGAEEKCGEEGAAERSELLPTDHNRHSRHRSPARRRWGGGGRGAGNEGIKLSLGRRGVGGRQCFNSSLFLTVQTYFNWP